jgi:hypothetical protein
VSIRVICRVVPLQKLLRFRHFIFALPRRFSPRFIFWHFRTPNAVWLFLLLYHTLLAKATLCSMGFLNKKQT